MLIGKKWKIESDSLNVILSQRKVRRPKGKPSYEDWEAVGYYPNVAEALKGLVNYEVKATELKDLQTVVKKIDELSKQIDRGMKCH